MGHFIEAFQRYWDFRGRSTRSNYWYFQLFSFIITVALFIVDEKFTKIGSIDNFGILGLMYGVFILVPSTMLAIRRLHDIGKSGWWMLISLIPIFGWILYFIWTIRESGEDNIYGEQINKFDQ